MDSVHFWSQVQQGLQAYPADRIASLQEQLSALEKQPTLAVEVMVQNICGGGIYLDQRVDLNLTESTLNLSFSPSQQDALGLGLSNNPLAVIAGVPGSGKTRIAKAIAQTAIQQNKQVLIVTKTQESLTAFADLSNHPFQRNINQSYEAEQIQQLRHAFSNATMDYLPLYLLPDLLLSKLRSRTELETWLPLLQTTPHSQLAQQLQQQFPEQPRVRIQLLAYRLHQLQPMLRQQLKLHQLYEELSDQDIQSLAIEQKNTTRTILATIADVLSSPTLWQRSFDWVIVDDVGLLSWAGLLLLAGLAKKLVLLGTPPLPESFAKSANSKALTCPFHSLLNQLLPTYRCHLNEQFRLHTALAKPVYETISDCWIHTYPRSISTHLPDHPSRLIWQDIPGNAIAHDNSYLNELEGRRLLEFLQQNLLIPASKIGIITFYTAQRDWLQAHCPPRLSNIKIGTIAEWVGQERSLVLLSCVGQATQVTPEDIATALTRGQDYLMIFGQVDHWRQHSSLMQSLLSQPSLHKERLAVLT